jgi:hypothetical protein
MNYKEDDAYHRLWINNPPRLATLDTPPCKQGGAGGGSTQLEIIEIN